MSSSTTDDIRGGAATARPSRSRVLALVLAGAGLVAAVTGALLPWFTSETDSFGEEALTPRVAAVVIAAAAAVLVVLRVRLGVVLGLAAFAVAMVVGLSEGPGQLCWDGADADGNAVGGCDQQEWTLAPVPFLVGCWLVAVAGVVTAVARRPSR